MKLNITKIKKINLLCKKYDILVLILFGSRANNTYNSKSDWDFGFYSSFELDFKKQMELKYSLMKIIDDSNLDLVNINKVSTVVLRKEIFFTGKCIYEKKQYLFENFKDKILMEYLDFKPYIKMKEYMLKEEIKSM